MASGISHAHLRGLCSVDDNIFIFIEMGCMPLRRGSIKRDVTIVIYLCYC